MEDAEPLPTIDGKSSLKLRIFIPMALLASIFAVWSIFWYHANAIAEATVDAWIAREAELGRLYTCASKTSGGYPFLLEQRCDRPTIELRAFDPPVILKARELVAIARVYQPTLMAAEVTGPISITQSGRSIVAADWKQARLNLRGLSSEPQRISLSIEDAHIDSAEPIGAHSLATVKHAELHIRLDHASRLVRPGLDISGLLFHASVPGNKFLPNGLFDAEIVAVLRGMVRFDSKSLAARLKELREAGARLEITKARVRHMPDGAVAFLEGNVGLSSTGRLDGDLTVTMTGFDDVVRELVRGNARTKDQAGALASLGLALLGQPTELDGKSAVAFPIRLSDGAVMLGPVQVGTLPPLY